MEQRLRELGESAFSAFVRKRSDAQLERTLGSGPGLRLMFKGMERAFLPEKANGFKGEVQYELTGARNGNGEWVVRRGVVVGLGVCVGLCVAAGLVTGDADPVSTGLGRTHR